MTERPSVTVGNNGPWARTYPDDPDERSREITSDLPISALLAGEVLIQKELAPFDSLRPLWRHLILKGLRDLTNHVPDAEFQQYVRDHAMSHERAKFEHTAQSLRRHSAGIVSHLTPLLAAKKSAPLLAAIQMYWGNIGGMTDAYWGPEFYGMFTGLAVVKAAMAQLHKDGALDPSSTLAMEFGYGAGGT